MNLKEGRNRHSLWEKPKLSATKGVLLLVSGLSRQRNLRISNL